VVLTLIGLAVFVYFNPFAGAAQPAEALRMAKALALLALLALSGVLVPWPLGSALLLLLAFVGSFANKSWYFLLLPYPPFKLVGLGTILYLTAGVTMAVVGLKVRAHRREG
jgi:hypothetical protein